MSRHVWRHAIIGLPHDFAIVGEETDVQIIRCADVREKQAILVLKQPKSRLAPVEDAAVLLT
jgi:hypothetical protein